MSLLFFALTLFVSAFLLFLVQPMIGKMILPKLGGTPQVWNTCMVFFQTALLAGYFYTHTVSTYLNVRRQVIVHCCLLLVPFAILLPWGPFNVVAWIPPSGNPVFATLFLLALVVGVPFFVVATSAPLLQKWFASTGHPAAKDPYFLYGASNLGSMLALLAYPVLVEPWFHLQSPLHDGAAGFDLGTQSWLWTAGYIVLVGLIVGCGAMVFLAPPSVALAGGHRPAGEKEASAAVEPPPPGPEMAAGEKPVIEPGAAETAPAPAATTAVTSSPPAPAPTAPPPKPGPSTAIKKGSKQKKHQKHQHKRDLPRHEAQREAFAQPAVAASLSKPAAASPGLTTIPRHQDELTAGRRLRWIGLAAVPSSFMLGVTTHMSTDISAIPLFWVVPLALYLLSFILVFMRWPVVWIGQPHMAVLIAQPVLLALLVISPAVTSVHQVIWLISINLLAFFATALVCHGELAKDRPSARHLTEFYLWMSVGGMLGGMFNGLFAPVLFPGLWEFSIAMMAAGLLRPVLKAYGWADQALAQMLVETPDAQTPKKGHVRSIRKSEASPSPGLTGTLDVALPIALLLLTLILQNIRNPYITYGVPLAIACFYYARPLRFGLALAAIILLIDMRGSGRESLLTERSYFGILNVRRGMDFYLEDKAEFLYYYTNLTHGTTDHGQNFLKPQSPWYGGKPANKLDLSRLATTYYHRTGPVGMAMERFDWFAKLGDIPPGDLVKYWNVYASDARMPVSLVGSGTSHLGAGALPIGQLVGAWSEPSYATIGLGTGTMASYARPFQHMHFYEIDERVRRYSLPDNKNVDPYFTYLRDALNRGAQVKVLMGDARLRMGQPWVPEKDKGKQDWEIEDAETNVWEKRGGPDAFYYLIVVDAFSSDAIPVHLLTRESVKIYMQKMAPGGVLCVHTSNRHLDLVPVVADVAASIFTDKETGQLLPDSTPEERKLAREKGQPLVCKRGRDNSPGHSRDPRQNIVLARKEHMGHTTSEWVIVARKPADLEYLKVPADYTDLRREQNAILRQRGFGESDEPYWSTPTSPGRYVWTDDYSNLLAVFRWPGRRSIE